MRYFPHTYEGARKSLCEKIVKLEINELLIPQSHLEVENYLAVADPIKGIPQPNMEWSHVNCRAGYQFDIPGLVSEILAQCEAAKLVGIDKVKIAQDKETQFERKIDFFADEDGVQSKTFRFNGTRTSFERSWIKGEAKILALTDIDDKVLFWIKKDMVEALINHNGLYIHKWDLEKHSDLWVNMKDWY